MLRGGRQLCRTQPVCCPCGSGVAGGGCTSLFCLSRSPVCFCGRGEVNRGLSSTPLGKRNKLLNGVHAQKDSPPFGGTSSARHTLTPTTKRPQGSRARACVEAGAVLQTRVKVRPVSTDAGRRTGQTSDCAKWGPGGLPAQVVWVRLSSTFANGGHWGPEPECSPHRWPAGEKFP